MTLTFEQLPEAVSRLTKIVENIERLYLLQGNQQPEAAKRWIDLKELCVYHPDNPKPPTVYGWIASSSIPHHKSGKKLRFLVSEIDQWLLNGKKKSNIEIAAEADTYLSTKKKSGGTKL